MPLTLDEVHSLLFPGKKVTLDSLATVIGNLKDCLKDAEERLSGHKPNQHGGWKETSGDNPSIAGALVSEKSARFQSINSRCTKKTKQRNKAFDMSTYRQRRIALELLYVGWGYMGSTWQPNEPNTVEGVLLRALIRTRLAPEEATLETLQLSRSGRTDKGVSGIGQVIALIVRSNAKVGSPPLAAGDECDYATTLNKALPPEIRVLGWTDIHNNFSARFSAKYREYRYFLACAQCLDLQAMQAAAQHFVGLHDFRNFCKVDAEHVNHFVRHVLDFRIEEMQQCSFGGRKTLQIHLRGSAFLWHQVRCMVAVLTLVGQQLEQPEIVKELLDVEAWGAKPQYNMAIEGPLLFYSCGYSDLAFHRSAKCNAANQAAVEELLTAQLAGAAVLWTMAQKLAEQELEYEVEGHVLSKVLKPAKYIKLVRRSREPTLAQKFAKFGRKLAQATTIPQLQEG